MDRSDVLTLISKTYDQDPLGQQIPTEHRRDVFCAITSVSASEWFEAGRNGLNPEYRAILFRFDYQGEETAEYKGTQYGIYRRYEAKSDMVELYLERKAGA